MSTRVIMDKSEYEELVAKAKEADDTADFIKDIIDENRRMQLHIKTLKKAISEMADDTQTREALLKKVIEENNELTKQKQTLEKRLDEYEDKLGYACVRLFDEDYDAWKNGDNDVTISVNIDSEELARASLRKKKSGKDV